MTRIWYRTIILGLLALLLSPITSVWSATLTGNVGDPVSLTGANELDVQILKQNGVVVSAGGTSPISSVRANQSLAAGTTIQHGGFTNLIELVLISSSGGALTSTASPQILAGTQGQIIVIQGTSDTNTYTLHDGAGVRLTTSGLSLFNTRSFMFLRYDSTGSVWREMTTLTGEPSSVPLSVKVATTANITLSGAQTIDGVSLTVTTPRQRVLVKNQTTPSQNGVYTVETGAWVRAFDFDESIEAKTNAVYVIDEGTLQAGNQCRLNASGAITLGTTSLAFSCLGPQTLTLRQQATDSAVPGADEWVIYCKSNGCFIRDDLGNITGPLGAAGGGGGTTVPSAVLVIPTNITLSGEQTFETVTTANTRVFVAGQSTQTQNGLYITNSGAWTRASDALVGASFTAGTLVTITGGLQTSDGNKGSVWMYTSSGTYNSSNLTSLRTAPGAAGELIASRSTITTSVANGTIGSDTGGRVPWNRAGSYAAHTDLSATSQINPGTQTIGIQNTGVGNVLLTTGTPRILGCSPAANGIHIYLVGLSTTKTVTIPDGQGVLLAGALGSGSGQLGGVKIGLAPGGTSAEFRCNGATSVWEQVSYITLQQARNAGRDMDGGVDEASGIRDGDITGGNYCTRWGNTQKCYCSGVACTGTNITNLVLSTNGAKPTCAVGERRKVWPTDGGAGVADTLEICKKDAADSYAWGSLGTGGGGGGTVTSTVPLSVDTINVGDSNAYMDTMDRTNYDTSVTRFTDNVTGCVHYKADIPANLATTPAWNVRIWHSAVSGAGGNVVLTLTAKTFATNVAKDAAYTSLTLPSSGVVAVSTSANTTLTTLGSTNFDGTVALTANQLLRLTLCRTGGSGSDSLNVDWLLEHISLRVDLN